MNDSFANNPFGELAETTRAKLQRCERILRSLGSVVVGYSGGVDSTLLLAMSVEFLGREKVLAVTGTSAVHARREVQRARDLAARLKVELIEIRGEEMDDDRFTANPPRRCYFCKHGLFDRLGEISRRRGFAAVVSGTNADDEGDFRPGHDALAELAVRSPLLEAGLTKEEIRAASRAMGLPTWSLPSMACLASRIPYGASITETKLRQIEQAEELLQDAGFAQCRARHHERVLRIEVPAEQIPRLIRLREQLVPALRELGFQYVTLDLQGFRSGSLNEALDVEATLPQRG